VAKQRSFGHHQHGEWQNNVLSVITGTVGGKLTFFWPPAKCGMAN
jgi:hypothetical protein